MTNYALPENARLLAALIAEGMAVRGVRLNAALDEGADVGCLTAESAELLIYDATLPLVTDLAQREAIVGYLFNRFGLANQAVPMFLPVGGVLLGLPPASNAAAHNALAGLNDGNYQHFTATQKTDLLALLMGAGGTGFDGARALTSLPTLGQNYGTTTLGGFLGAAFFSPPPPVPSSASLSVSPNALQEIGTSVTVTLDGAFAAGAAGAPTTAQYRQGAAVILPTQTGAAIGDAITVPTVSATTSYAFDVTFPTGPGRTATGQVRFAAPVFYGAGLPGQSASSAFLTALTKPALALTLPATQNLLFTQAVGQTRYYAQPASFGVLSLILNNLNYDVTGSYTRSQQTLTIGAASVLYDVYEYQTPTQQAVTGLRNTFNQ